MRCRLVERDSIPCNRYQTGHCIKAEMGFLRTQTHASNESPELDTLKTLAAEGKREGMGEAGGVGGGGRGGSGGRGVKVGRVGDGVGGGRA